MPRRSNKRGYVRVLSRHPSHSREFRNQIPTKRSVCWRLGSITPTNNAIQINTVEAVENSMDKLRMKQLFGDQAYSPNYAYWNGNSWSTKKGEMNDARTS